MTRFTSAIGMTFCAAAVIALSAISGASAHGYLNSPPPRGIQKASFLIDDLKSPNFKGVCRGEPAGTVTAVGHTVTLGFQITAPHIGMCEVYILDENLGNARKIDSKDGCAAPGKAGPWTINIPSDITGRKVIRWMWHAAHQVTVIEEYEHVPKSDFPAPALPAPAAPAAPVVPAAPATPAPSAGGSCSPGQFKCDGNKFGQCNFGSFIWMACGAGTTCKSSGNSVHCG
ncbi:hypothetical protein BDF19DRAFT_452398 [Syncephalis fuscata]|nr:hypothetical protein BDF19DRAFT_452398 [Syncephalis fuscata]